MKTLLALVVAVLALGGIGASVHHFMDDPYNAGFLDWPGITGLHVILGGVYLALAPFQFVRRLRVRFLGYHRWTGRLLVGTAPRVDGARVLDRARHRDDATDLHPAADRGG